MADLEATRPCHINFVGYLRNVCMLGSITLSSTPSPAPLPAFYISPHEDVLFKSRNEKVSCIQKFICILNG